MIERAASYKVGDAMFATLEEAQQYELKALLLEFTSGKVAEAEVERVTEALVEHADKVIDILTTSAKSRAKARKINGAKRTRKATAPMAHVNSTPCYGEAKDV